MIITFLVLMPFLTDRAFEVTSTNQSQRPSLLARNSPQVLSNLLPTRESCGCCGEGLDVALTIRLKAAISMGTTRQGQLVKVSHSDVDPLRDGRRAAAFSRIAIERRKGYPCGRLQARRSVHSYADDFEKGPT